MADLAPPPSALPSNHREAIIASNPYRAPTRPRKERSAAQAAVEGVGELPFRRDGSGPVPGGGGSAQAGGGRGRSRGRHGQRRPNGHDGTASGRAGEQTDPSFRPRQPLSDVDRLLSGLSVSSASRAVEPVPAPSAQPHAANGAQRGAPVHVPVLDPTAPTFEPSSGPSGAVPVSTLDRSAGGRGGRGNKTGGRNGARGGAGGEGAISGSARPNGSAARDSAPRKPKALPKPRVQVENDTGAIRSSRRAAFEKQSRLTDGRKDETDSASVTSGDTSAAAARPDGKQVMRRERKREEEKDDLLSKLMRGLRQRPYLECPICFNPINPSQPIWSCLPPSVPPSDAHSHSHSTLNPITAQPSPTVHQACYTPFHLKCIRSWASQSLEADAARLASFGLDKEDGDEPSWRCPGCQKRREEGVGEYTCFCGRVRNPEGGGAGGGEGAGGGKGRGAMPHSCGESCGRRRTCGHACSLNCHPGPCPPCQVSLIVTCPSHATPLTVKCALAHSPAHPGALSPICDEPCLRPLGCGEHVCQRLCHFGECGGCEEREVVRCFCGAEEREVACGWKKGEAKMCGDAGLGDEEDGANASEMWEGRWECGRVCGRKYDCGVHECEETCHPHPLTTPVCPFSPARVLTCPCGQTPLTDLPVPARTSCLDTIPTCSLPCPRSRACGHPCPFTCHSGPCPTCTAQVVRPCRCGESRVLVPCSKLEALEAGSAITDGDTEGSGIRCERVCRALRNCGKHECGRVCCPLAHLAKNKGRTAKVNLLGNALLPRRQDGSAPGEEMHDCPLTCGKLLGCGIHTCERKDHKGKCGRCLQASYDELICHCGRTVIYPPVPCGTTLSCPYPCTRPPPSCGHPKSSHPCHQDDQCPPCPYLTTRPCACGKDPGVKNVRCSTSPDKVSCGQACGRLLPCGYHRCDRPCHLPPEAGGECGDGGLCTQTCSKPRKICGHPCTHTCHAPTRCPESEACQALILQTCACGHLQQRATCGASTANPTSRERQGLKCNSECLVRQRNARLAEALGIDEGRESRVGKTDWTDEMRRFALVNHAWVKVVEKTLGEFIEGGRAMQILPSMPAAKRTFVLQLAESYRLAASLIDEPPNESVQIRRRADSKVPTPLLSVAATPAPAASAKTPWGGLGNLRAPAPTSAAPSAPTGNARSAPSNPAKLGTASWGRSAHLAPSSPAPTSTSAASHVVGMSETVHGWSSAPLSASTSTAASREPSRAATPVAPSVLEQTGGQRAGGVGGGAGHVPGLSGVTVGRAGEVEDVDWDED